MPSSSHNTAPAAASTKGYTLVELLITIAIVGILFAIASLVVIKYKKAAYKITAKHDLMSFVKAEAAYFTEYGVYKGKKGQKIRNDGKPSSLALDGFMPTKGVVITIKKGIPKRPDVAFVAESEHQQSDTKFRFNFKTGKLKEKPVKKK